MSFLKRLLATLYGRWKPWKDALITRVKGSPVWRATAASVRAIHIRPRSLLQRMRGGSD